jgi:hypothetical protein
MIPNPPGTARLMNFSVSFAFTCCIKLSAHERISSKEVLATWAEHPWRCLSCGAPIDPHLADTDEPIFKTYRRVVASLTRSTELKRLLANGAEIMRPTARGLTIPRPVHVTKVLHMGKEVIVDPSDTPEELTVEQLYATDPLIYRGEDEELDILRAEVRAIGVNAVSRAAGVARSRVQAFVNEGATPQPETVEKIRAAIEVLRRRPGGQGHALGLSAAAPNIPSR